MPIGPLGMLGVSTGANLFTGIVNNALQVGQQERLNDVNAKYNKQMTDYNMEKQLEMWERTGYKPQVDQMKEAGLNPALMYKGSGAGGQTAVSTMQQGAAQANPKTMGIEAIAQLALLKAQTENINADTKNKLESAGNQEAQAEGKGLENAYNKWMQSTTMDGKDVGANMDESIRGRREKTEVEQRQAETKFKLEENERQKLMNSEVMKKIGAEIELMAQQGKNLKEIWENLHKEGKILDAEIEWNALDIKDGNVGKFLMNFIKTLVKPR